MTNWCALGSDVMKKARTARGLSYEGVARQSSVSSKTYERYEKRGAVPEHMVETFARILGLEIERPSMTKVILGETDDRDVLELLRDLEQRLGSLEATVARADDVEASLRRLQVAIDRIANKRKTSAAGSA